MARARSGATPEGKTRADLLRAELAEFVRIYHEHNIEFERRLTERHARWTARGLLTGEPSAAAAKGSK